MKACALDPAILLTAETDSDAHIIPSALGGTLKPRGILSRKSNTLLDKLVDGPFIQGWLPIMQLIGGVPDRGKPGTLRMEAPDGQVYIDRGEGFLAPQKPTYRTFPSADGCDILHAQAGTTPQLRQILEKAKKDHPDLDIEEALRQAELGHEPTQGPLTVSLKLGASIEFPAAFAAASLFAIAQGVAPHPAFTDYIASLDRRQGKGPPPLPPDTFYWHHGPDPRTVASARISHVVILHASAARQRMIVYLEYFNASCIAVTLPYRGHEDVWRTYGVDILTGQTVEVEPDRAAFAARPWEASHPPDAPPEDLGERIGRTVDASRPHKLRGCITAVFDRHLGNRKPSELSEEHKATMLAEAYEVAAIFLGLWPLRRD